MPPSAPLLSAPLLFAAGPEIDINPTFVVVQLVLFSALIVVLKPLLIDPMLRVFEAREERTEGARGEARELQERAGELLRKYEAELEKVHRTAAEERDRLRAETAHLEARILQEAREATARIVEEGRQRAEGELARVKVELSQRAPALAREAAAAVLGREVR